MYSLTVSTPNSPAPQLLTTLSLALSCIHACKLTWAAVGGQVAVTVAIARSAAVDAAVILVGAVVGPCVR